ncbi:MAG: FkbM family methyltransferase [Limisphaerales bacterium]
MLQRLWKPWFWYRPAQLGRRVVAELRPLPPGVASLRTSWGASISADPGRTIGKSILTTGLYDLAVSEALFRLISPRDTVVDAGANIGYMTVLAGVASGPEGRVISFEPHPELFAALERNVAQARLDGRMAEVELHQAALGERPGSAELHIPPEFESNDGVARIGSEPASGGRAVTVRVATLDDVIANARIGLMKLDVEGFEPQVLKGSQRALAERRIRNIVFEDHSVGDSEVVRILAGAGYRLFSLGWSMRGLRVEPIGAGNLAAHYEAPSFIATVEPEELLNRCRPRGWRALRCQTRRRA